MNAQNAKEYLPFVKALAEGKKIQVGGYYLEDVVFDSHPSMYTIAPEPASPTITPGHQHLDQSSMSDTNDGGPAFPVLEMHTDGKSRTTMPGMSLRDWFAAQANEQDIQTAFEDAALTSSRFQLQGRAWARYHHADAMLAERNKQP